LQGELLGGSVLVYLPESFCVTLVNNIKNQYLQQNLAFDLVSFS